jgi:uncharacterized protein YdiU (UPF0061 family)
MRFENTYNSLPDRFYSEASPACFSKPMLLGFNENLSTELGLNLSGQSSENLAAIFSGQNLLKGSSPIAMALPVINSGILFPSLKMDERCFSEKSLTLLAKDSMFS